MLSTSRANRRKVRKAIVERKGALYYTNVTAAHAEGAEQSGDIAVMALKLGKAPFIESCCDMWQPKEFVYPMDELAIPAGE